MPAFHATDDLLLRYASGHLPEAQSLVIATHLALCPICRARVAEYEALGGALVEDLDPVPVAEDALADVLARLDEPDRARGASDRARDAAARPKAPLSQADLLVPRPLRDYLGIGLGELSWRRLMPGLEEADIEVGPESARARLMRVESGKGMPRHSHEGEEMTLVLSGAYRDESGCYRRGDLQIADPEIDHRPVADESEPCICLVVTDAPLKLTGPFGRLLNPFVSYR